MIFPPLTLGSGDLFGFIFGCFSDYLSGCFCHDLSEVRIPQFLPRLLFVLIWVEVWFKNWESEER